MCSFALARIQWEVTAAAFKQKLETEGKAVGTVLKRIKTLITGISILYTPWDV